MKKVTHEDFVKKANCVHNGVYEYISRYISTKDKVEIKCRIHGIFLKTPKKHLQGQGCTKCSREKQSLKQSKDLNYYLIKAKEIHNDKYDYSKFIYKKKKEKSIIICKEGHGEFLQDMNAHIGSRAGCPKCGVKTRIEKELSKNNFIEKATAIHGNKYEYLCSYTGRFKNISILCKEHGEFSQIAGNHLSGKGCPKCGKIKLSRSNQENPSGWSHTNWQKAAEKSKNFDGYKVYILECKDQKTGEHFFKIGKTFTTIFQRFKNKRIPYNYKIYKTYHINNPQKCSEFEQVLKNKNKEFKYLPKKSFYGRFECFSQIK